ncbi:MAG: hypothetical protein AAB740_04575 [Patescibacteria group bacterium]
MEKFYYKKILVGFRVKTLPEGSVPLTDSKEPLQVLALCHKKNGHRVAAHFHTPSKRISNHLQECLIVKKGRIKISLYGPDHKYFKSIQLKKGELFILLCGGYGVDFLEDSEVFELKNGPFKNDKVIIKDAKQSVV